MPNRQRMRNSFQQSRLFFALAIILGISALFILNSNFSFREEQVVQESETQEALSEVTEILATKIARLGILGNGFSGVVTLQPDLDQASFETFASIQALPEPGIVNIAAIQDETIQFVYPFEDNKSLVGFQYADNPQQLQELRRVRESGASTLQGPINLLQGFPGYVLRIPIYTGAGRNQRFWGSLAIVLSQEGFMSDVVSGDISESIDIAIRNLENEAPIFGSQSIFSSGAVVRTVALPGHVWEVAALPKNGWLAFDVDPQHIALYVLSLAIALSLLEFIMKQRSRALWASEQLEAAVSVLADGFVLFDENDRLVLCNDKFLEIYQRSAPSIRKGATFEEIIRYGLEHGQYPEASGREADWLRERLDAHRRADRSLEQRLVGGRWLRIEEKATPSGGRVGIRIDVTELVESKLQAQKADDAKTQFLNVISHELRTPMTVILGYNAFLGKVDLLPEVKRLKEHAGTLDDEALGKHLQSALDGIMRVSGKIDVAGTQLMNLISDMLDLARIESQTIKIEPAKVNAVALVSSIVEQTMPLVSGKGLVLETRVEDVDLSCDETRVRQVFFNLISNAVKFTDAGEITIRSETKGSFIEFEVRDTGTGIPPEALSAIFNRFAQVDATSTRNQGGLGLGLAITKELVELQGGSISAESAVGHGTAIRFTLPIWKGDADGTFKE